MSTQLSLADKLKILDRLKNGEKKEKIMSDFDIVLQTLQRIAKNESQGRQDSLSMQSTQKHKQTGRFKDADAALEKWFLSVREQNIIITG